MSKSVLSSLDGMLPDERPVLSLQVVETVAKCPAGYWPVSRTYDEDADAGLLKQSGIFGKKPTHYICLSKSEGLPGYVLDGLAVVGEREAPPAGFGVAGRAGKRRLCTRVSRRAAPAQAAPPVTDVIVCSRMRQAPQGFLPAGEINGKIICYKVSAAPADSPADNNYENVVSGQTPDASRRIRSGPERPPKLSPLMNELNDLNLKQTAADEFNGSHDYEALSTSYNIKPIRPAPPAPHRNSTGALQSPVNSSLVGPTSPPLPAGRHKKGPAPLPRVSNYNTLGSYNAMEGVPFILNPKLKEMSVDAMSQLPIIKRKTRSEVEKEFSYSFSIERDA